MDEIILKYLKKEMSIEDQHRLTRWLSEDELNRKILNKIELFWDREPDRAEKAKNRVWSELLGHIELPDQQSASESRPVSQAVWSVLKVAAILIIAFFLSFLVFENVHRQEGTVTEQVRYVEKVSLPGQKIHIQLPDGSKVKLNAGSRLIAPERFNDQTREVELVGEAFFDIERDEKRPFIVRSGDVNVEVLGTAFNMRAYPEEANIRVAVDRGKVAVKGERQQNKLVLLPDEMAVYDIRLGTSSKQAFDHKAAFSWTNKTLYFDQANINEIIHTLERWYGVKFILKKSLDQKRDFSGEYYNKPLQTVLDGLAYVYGFNYQIKDEIVTLN